ncbi:hypothetical protein QT17_08920 [Thermus sp. 2.9]|uniref:hypothetical protein n=1 Tax=Thermus sp. (strain 2.9) TaxID=1577051 RepID=UPI000541A3C0|nr:hypothetical protein [Thermus sp. 2.9]KHG65003.1 hypothetical protein QT17_08920 [Thermus sp. 2.9]
MRWVELAGGVGLGLALGLAATALERAFHPNPVPLAPCWPAPLPERAELWTTGAVELSLCRPATLVLDLEGTPARGKGPHTLVVEGDRVLWEGEVLGKKTLRVKISGRGVVVLAFTDDLYLPPQDRNLFLRGLRVEP